MEVLLVMEVKKPEVARADSALGFSIAIGLGLVLFIAGLIVSLTVGDGTGVGLLFGIPLMIAGVILPLFMMRENFTAGHNIEAPCPNCGTVIKTSDGTLKLECPTCRKIVFVRDSKLHLT